VVPQDSEQDRSAPPIRQDTTREGTVDLQGRVARFYDQYAEKEWSRLEDDARRRVVFELHRRVLARFVSPGNRILDVGAGPGRFSIEVARLDATVVTGDISPIQISLAKQILSSRLGLDVKPNLAVITALHLPFKDEAFDHVVCFGSVLSHLAKWQRTLRENSSAFQGWGASFS
jgi:2-polyprenyl-3-methyl-5-hydroxy-6-metoxy-1,4-benzoquinol methylase